MTDSDERQRLRMQQSAIREEIRRRAEQSSSIGHSTSDAQAPTSAMRARPQSYRQRARDRLQDQSSPSASGGTVQQAVERLNQASSNLSSLLDQPNLRLSSPDGNARDHLGEAEVNRRGAKRRKMDANPLAVGHLRGFNYGHRGQVVSGPLKMEIFVCDGGLHGDSATHEREYMPENVLRNDKSVYCTSGNTCNLILRHMGETTFCLKKLVIKAPERGFTAP